MRIKQLRIESNLPQKELAVAIGISQSKLSKVELGFIKPGIELLQKISSCLKVPVEMLYRNDSDNMSEELGNQLPSNNKAAFYKEQQEIEPALLTQAKELRKIIRHKDMLIMGYKSIISLLRAKIASDSLNTIDLRMLLESYK